MIIRILGYQKPGITALCSALAVALIFSCVGMSPQTGLARFTFGQVSLMDGISLIPMLIGLFGITSILEMIEGIQTGRPGGDAAGAQVKETEKTKDENNQKVKVILPDKTMSKRLFPIWIQSSVIGNIIGIIPGAGMIMAIFMAYDQASRRRPKLAVAADSGIDFGEYDGKQLDTEHGVCEWIAVCICDKAVKSGFTGSFGCLYWDADNKMFEKIAGLERVWKFCFFPAKAAVADAQLFGCFF